MAGTRSAARPAVEAAARCGFVARGVIYLLVGVLAIQVAFGRSGQQADRSGEVGQIAGQPFGGVLLVWALGVGLAGMALWRLSEAVFGAAGPDGRKITRRLASLARSVLYGVVAYSVVAFALGEGGGGSGDQQSKDVTARVMELPLGRWLVAAGGLTLVGAGIVIAVGAVMRTFRKDLRTGEMAPGAGRVVDVLGVAGGVCREAVFATAGGFAVAAAIRYDADQAKGPDDTLRTFSGTPAGPWVLVAVATGLTLFGLFSFALARWRKV